jgi:hypothetical protein
MNIPFNRPSFTILQPSISCQLLETQIRCFKILETCQALSSSTLGRIHSNSLNLLGIDKPLSRNRNKGSQIYPRDPIFKNPSPSKTNMIKRVKCSKDKVLKIQKVKGQEYLKRMKKKTEREVRQD